MRRGALFSLLLAAVFVMRIVVPSGWMPVADASGFHIRPCSGWTSRPKPEPAGQLHLHHGGHQGNADKKPTQEHEANHSGQPCAFAGLGMAFLDAPDLPSISALPFEVLTPEILPSTASAQRLAAPPPPATGPPSTA